MSNVRKRITFSNVVAVLALFVALGGSAYAAGKLNGKTIKPKTIPANRIKPDSLTGKQIKEASVSEAVTYVTTPLSLPADPGATSTVQTATATCPAGLKAIGGGALFSDPSNNFIQDEGLTPDQSGYLARAFRDSAVGNTLTVTAACVKVAS